MFWDTKDMKETHKIWDDIKALARRYKCIKIQFTTKRDGKLWERRFKDMKVAQWKIEADLNE